MKQKNIPTSLKQNALWCVWKWNGENKKIPINPITGEYGQSNNRSTFSDFETAATVCDRDGYAGLGLGIFNGFSAIDIDHCIEKGQLSEMAKDIIDRMDSYTEISPSGTGIRIIFTVKDFAYDTDRFYINNQKIGLEVYVSGATNKFVTITGDTLCKKPIRSAAESLSEVLQLYMGRATKSITPKQTPLTKETSLLDIGLQKDKKLIAYWSGDRPLQSESENDMGFMAKLLYWTNGNVDVAIQAFLSSPYAMQKDDKHKKKLNRKDYLPRVAQAAMPNCTAAEKSREWQEKQNKKVKKSTEKENNTMENKMPSIISAKSLQKAIFPPVTYLVDGFLPMGTSILSAASKIGKSWLVLDMGLKIAAGVPFMGKQTTQTGVLYFALEDSLPRLQSRMEKLLNGSEAPDGFYFAVDAPTMDNQFLDCVKAYLDEDPTIKLLIIDTLQKVRGQARHGEQAYQQDYREMGLIKKFADQHGISVLFVHHNRKMKDDSDPFNMISGTTGIMGAADTALVITKKKREDKEATLHITGRDVEQSDLEIWFDSEWCRWELVGTAKEVKDEKQRQSYYTSPIIKAVKALLHNSPDGKWKGNAKKLMTEGEMILHMPISHSSQAVGNYLGSIPIEMFMNDGIGFTPSPNGNAGHIYQFWFLPKEDEFDNVEF